MPTLYIVATPIGNLEDITLRALKTLKSVHLILAEDTRTTKKLLDRYGIDTPRESVNAHTEERKIARILGLLREGKDIALVTDAGTPGISDPGARTVSRVREEEPNATIVPIPGPSALTAALSVSGIASSEFLFLGFLPHKKGRETLFKEIAESKHAVVLFESPHRLVRTLEKLATLLDGDRRVVVCREISKVYEETVSGTARSVLDEFARRGSVKGEVVLIIEGKRK
jgi:16S rRNA (cytidine1402-2'-O)-methyltransferase